MNQQTKRAVIAGSTIGSTYDNSAKEVFKHKEILAPLLKYSVPEFKDYSVSDIARFIDADTIRTDIPVEDLPPLAIDRGTENPSFTEKDVNFDKHFLVKNPMLSSEDSLVMLHFDLEFQNDYQPGNPRYPIVSRAMYYTARELGRQLGPLKEDTDYSKLKKVYSIWICNDNIPVNLRNTVSIYSMQKKDFFGETNESQSDYDLMSVIIIRRGSECRQDGLNIFDFLSSVFNGDLERLDEYTDTKSDPTVREDVEKMTGLGDALIINAKRDADENALRNGVNAGIVKTPEEAAIMFPELDKDIVDGIFQSYCNRKEN